MTGISAGTPQRRILSASRMPMMRGLRAMPARGCRSDRCRFRERLRVAAARMLNSMVMNARYKEALTSLRPP